MPSLRSCTTARAFGFINFTDSTLCPYNYYVELAVHLNALQKLPCHYLSSALMYEHPAIYVLIQNLTYPIIPRCYESYFFCKRKTLVTFIVMNTESSRQDFRYRWSEILSVYDILYSHLSVIVLEFSLGL